MLAPDTVERLVASAAQFNTFPSSENKHSVAVTIRIDPTNLVQMVHQIAAQSSNFGQILPHLRPVLGLLLRQLVGLGFLGDFLDLWLQLNHGIGQDLPWPELSRQLVNGGFVIHLVEHHHQIDGTAPALRLVVRVELRTVDRHAARRRDPVVPVLRITMAL